MPEAEKKEDIKEEKKEPAKISAGQIKAQDSGWRPQDDWSGDADDWVDWKEFNFRGELMGRINEQSGVLHTYKGQVEEQKKVIDDLAALQKGIADREYKKAIRQLRQEKAQAVDDGEGAKVVEIEEEIDNLKERKAEADAVPAAPAPTADDSVPPEVVAWLSKPDNQWYHQDLFLKSVADGYAKSIKEGNPTMSPAALLAQVDKAMKTELPHRFRSGSQVDGEGDLNQRDRSNGKKPTFADLDDVQQACANRFEASGVMTKSEYIEELVAAGDL